MSNSGIWQLQNPRAGLTAASISLGGGAYRLAVQWDFSSSLSGDGYPFKTLTAAKRYFARHYQSKKHNFNTPQWKEL